MRRPDAISTSSSAIVLTVTPMDRSGGLPAWRPTPPRGDWTPEAVFAASVAYAITEAADAGLSLRRVVLIAQIALFDTLPPTVKRTQLVERLRGIDRVATYFDELNLSRVGEDLVPRF